jgi:hypothetical protein
MAQCFLDALSVMHSWIQFAAACASLTLHFPLLVVRLLLM